MSSRRSKKRYKLYIYISIWWWDGSKEVKNSTKWLMYICLTVWLSDCLLFNVKCACQSSASFLISKIENLVTQFHGVFFVILIMAKWLDIWESLHFRSLHLQPKQSFLSQFVNDEGAVDLQSVGPKRSSEEIVVWWSTHYWFIHLSSTLLVHKKKKDVPCRKIVVVDDFFCKWWMFSFPCALARGNEFILLQHHPVQFIVQRKFRSDAHYGQLDCGDHVKTSCSQDLDSAWAHHLPCSCLQTHGEDWHFWVWTHDPELHHFISLVAWFNFWVYQIQGLSSNIGNLPLPPSTSHASKKPFPRLFLQHLAASFVRLPVAPRDACEKGTSWSFPHCHPTWSEQHASFLLAR